MKCINCGKKEAKVENLCEDCFLKIHPILKKVKPFTINKCVKCNSLFDGNKAIKSSEQLNKLILKHLSLDNSYTIKDITVSLEELEKYFLANITFKASVDSKEFEDNYEIEIPIQKFVCSLCSKKASNYFEGVFQLLSDDEEIVEFTEKLFEKDNVPISQKKKTKRGFDYYVIDKKKMKRIGEKLVERFGGSIKEAASIHTKDRQTSKDVYRLNIAYKPLRMKKGDVFFYNDRIYQLLNAGKTNKVLDILNAKETRIKNDKYFKLPKFKARVVSKRPLKVLDENYELIRVKNPLSKNIKLNSKVKIVEFDGDFYIVN